MRKTGEDNEDRKMAGFFPARTRYFSADSRENRVLEGLDRHQSLGKKGGKVARIRVGAESARTTKEKRGRTGNIIAR